MTDARYDVIVVGARCAGATLAAYLARSGASVLLLDKDTLPSDQVMSTHTVHPPGIEIFEDLGVGEAIRDVTPPVRRVRLSKSGAALDLTYSAGRIGYCPRRKRLDGLLQDAATKAGAELRDQTRVTSLLEDDGRVVGVRAVRDGRTTEYRASLVVGADGRRSTIAQLVSAEEYLGYDAPRGMYWAYWDAPAIWWDDARYPFDLFVAKDARNVRVIFQTDHEQLLVGSLPTRDEIGRWRADPLRALQKDLAENPWTGPLVEGSAPDGKVRGTIKERYFFRRGAGPGWALVGDAGHHKDFVLGDGITEAALQARSLAEAIAEGTDGALERWWRARDVAAVPYYFFAEDEGAAEPPPELQRVVFERLAERPELAAGIAKSMEHEISPYEALPFANVLGWTVGALLRGRLGVLAEFVEIGKRNAFVGRELKAREKLLADVS